MAASASEEHNGTGFNVHEGNFDGLHDRSFAARGRNSLRQEQEESAPGAGPPVDPVVPAEPDLPEDDPIDSVHPAVAPAAQAVEREFLRSASASELQLRAEALRRQQESRRRPMCANQGCLFRAHVDGDGRLHQDCSRSCRQLRLEREEAAAANAAQGRLIPAPAQFSASQLASTVERLVRDSLLRNQTSTVPVDVFSAGLTDAEKNAKVSREILAKVQLAELKATTFAQPSTKTDLVDIAKKSADICERLFEIQRIPLGLRSGNSAAEIVLRGFETLFSFEKEKLEMSATLVKRHDVPLMPMATKNALMECALDTWTRTRDPAQVIAQDAEGQRLWQDRSLVTSVVNLHQNRGGNGGQGSNNNRRRGQGRGAGQGRGGKGGGRGAARNASRGAQAGVNANPSAAQLAASAARATRATLPAGSGGVGPGP